MVIMVVVCDRRVTWTVRPLLCMCMVRTAAQREMQQKSGGGDQSDERAHWLN